MRLQLRSCFLAVALPIFCVLALPPTGNAQVRAPLMDASADGAGAAPDPIILPTSRKTANQIKAAHEYIAAKDWDNAVKLLQRVLDESEDSLLETPIKDPQGKEIIRRTSARAEAERLLVTLPKPGQTAYRVKFGGLAVVALGKARANPQLLDQMVRRYLLTDAGAEALTSMGVSALDRGQVDEGADCFRRLLGRPDVDDLPPLTLFQAALAFHAANDAAHENQVMQILGRRISTANLPIGDRALTLDDVRKEIARWPSTVMASTDWPLFRGDLSRSGRANGEYPLLEARSRAAIPVYDEVNKLLAPQAGLSTLVGGGAAAGGGVGPAGVDADAEPEPFITGPSLPGFVPIAVGGKVIYRGPDGLHALDAESGKEVWRHVPPMCLDTVLKDDQKKWQMRRWLGLYRGFPSLLDDNATLGTLSSDGRRVYFVEDLPAPPHPSDLKNLQDNGGVGKHWFSTAEGNLHHNRLRAVDAKTGELRWEIGAWQKDPRRELLEPLSNAFFLGAPLPVGPRLFVLVERAQEINLLCLDSSTGDLLWSQNLASVPSSIESDAARRMRPVHLAYADGVLVCPTNAGAVVAVDPLSHNLLWAHLYEEAKPSAVGDAAEFLVPGASVQEGWWKGGAPIIHGDRVLLSAPSGASGDDPLLCLNLHNGSVMWESPRMDDLYVAGVFEDKVLIVGKRECRAVALADGREAWRLPTAMPSGVGAASGSHYFLPLQAGGVYLLDVTNPRASAHIEGRPGEALGNLVFYSGTLWSQSPTAVTAYTRLAKSLELAEARVAANHGDPAARIDRARLLYAKGEAKAAVDDWLFALDHNPPAELAGPARERVHSALTQLLRQDFAANEKYLARYAELCRTSAPGSAIQRRRLLDLRTITARGRESQGRADLALTAYQEVYDSAVANEYMEDPEDLSVRIRPELWAQTRIALLTRAANAAQQQLLRERIDKEWRAVQTAGDSTALARFVGLYGTIPGALGAAGREARLTLAERLLEDRDHGRALEAEIHLHYLRRQTDSPEIAARAQYAWARLLTRHGLLADAVEAYSALGRNYPGVVVHEGKTGAALVAELAADKRFIAFLDDPLASQPSGPVKVKEIKDKNTPKGQELVCEPWDGVAPPCCRNLRLSLDAQTFALKVITTDGSTEPWSVAMPAAGAYLRFCLLQGGFTTSYQASDHFLVVAMGPLIVGVDRLEHRVCWARSLLPAEAPPNAMLQPGGADGSVYWMTTTDGRPLQRLGVLGPIGPDGVHVQTKEGVAALDLATGNVRWLRTDAPPWLEAFGDEEYLYLAESHQMGEVRAVRSIRTADGAAVAISDCVDCYKHKVGNMGRRLLSSRQNAKQEVEFRFYDVQTGKDLWQKTFPANSAFIGSPSPELFAVAAPNGTVTVVDLNECKELLRLAVEPKHLEKLVRGMLLRDRTQFYLAFQGPPEGSGDPYAALGAPVKTTEVNGMIYAFDRATGEQHWVSRALAQMLVLDHFNESPVLLMTAVQQRQAPGAPGGNPLQVSCTRSIDKKTGKVLYRKEIINNPDPYFGLEINVRTGTIDLISANTRLRHYIEAGK
jgi:outer membrane protein assembly factor BamB